MFTLLWPFGSSHTASLHGCGITNIKGENSEHYLVVVVQWLIMVSIQSGSFLSIFHVCPIHDTKIILVHEMLLLVAI